MNNFAKGSLAAGAGLVLLLGGAGTLAYWNDSAELSGGTITAGEMTFTADTAAFVDSQLTQWVPGDEHTYTTNLTLETSGDNIQGYIVLDDASIVRTGAGADAIEVAVSMDEAAIVKPTDGVVSFTDEDPAAAGGEKITFDGPGTYTIPVEVTVSFPFGTTADNTSMSATVDLTGATFTATQTDPNTAVAG